MPTMKRPRRPVPRNFGNRNLAQKPKAHFVRDGDSWRSFAVAYQMDPVTIQHFNFATADREELNWYLHEYVGCRKASQDDKTFVFSSDDTNNGHGMIMIPQLQIGSAKIDGPPEVQKSWYLPKSDRKGMSRLSQYGVAQVDRNYRNTYFERGRAGSISYSGKVTRGQRYIRKEGDRIVLGATSTDVFFLIDGKAYRQGAFEFTNDVLAGAFEDAGKSAMGMVRLVEIEMAFFMGIASAGSAIGFVAVAGTNLIKSLSENDIRGLIKKLAAVYAATSALKKVAPTLHDRLFSWSTAWDLIVETGKRLPRSLATLKPEDYAQLLGGIVAKVGVNAAKEGLKQFIGLAVSLLAFIGTKLAPAAVKLGAADLNKRADELIATLRVFGINLANRDATAITEELHKKRGLIAPILQKLERDAR